MAYDPSDLRLPHWLLRLMDWLVRIEIPLGRRWRLGMTRPGIMLTSVLMGLWAASFYSGNNLLYLCGAMLTALAIVAIWQGKSLLKSVPSLSVVMPQYTVASEKFLFREQLPGVQEARAWIELLWLSGEAAIEAQVRLEEGTVVSGAMWSQRRGVFRLGGQKLSTSAPLGLWHLHYERDDPVSWMVLPRPVPWAAQLVGKGRRTTVLDGDELRDLRAYLPGDPLSRIHWRKAAVDPVQWKVKRFEEQDAGQSDELLRVDLRLPQGETSEKFEELLGRAWYWIEGRWHEHSRFQVIFGQAKFTVDGRDQLEGLIRAVVEASPETSPVSGSGGTLLSLMTSE